MASNKEIKVAPAAVEFLSDAVEIAESPIPWFCRIGIPLIALIVLAALAWACFCQVDVIVRAQGKVVSERGDIIMKAHDSAVIRSIEVRKGDIVEAGQVLISFDPDMNLAEIHRLKQELNVLNAERERYLAEYEHKEFVPGADCDLESAAMQMSIYKQRQSYYKEKLSYYDSNLAQVKASIASSEESYKKYQEILGNMTTIEEMYAKLLVKNAVAHKDLLDVQVNRMEVEVQVDRLRNQIVASQCQLNSLESERQAFTEEWDNSIAEKLVSLYREIDSNQKQLEKVEVLASYVDLRAPCKAVVQDMASFPVGSAVGEAEAIITLVPLEGLSIVEAEIRPEDISRVREGSQARVKLTAFPFQKHGTLEGVVRLISANTFNRSEASKMTGAQSSYYRVELPVNGTLRNVKDDFRLIPGMETEVEIKSGKRRIIEYIINPIIKGLDESFREP